MIQVKKLLPIWFIPEEEEDATDPSKFFLKPLTATQFAAIRSATPSGDKGQVWCNEAALIAAAKQSIIGWSNILDDSGGDLEFSKEQIEQIPYGTLLEVGLRVITRSISGEDEKEN